MPETPDAKLAVLIDADNAQPAGSDALVAEIAKFGVASVKRVYGEPYEKDGLTVIPAAVVGGGAGGGAGHDDKGQEGEGGGFGVSGRPAGAYVTSLDEEGRTALRDAFHTRIGSPEGAFSLSATARAVVATVPSAS